MSRRPEPALLLLRLALLAAGLAIARPSLAAENLASASHSEIYARSNLQFACALFLKPIERAPGDLFFKMAPLILQEAKAGQDQTAGERDRFGFLDFSNAAPVLDHSRPALYAHTDRVRLGANDHDRFTYLWWYSLDAQPHKRTGLAVQGVRITLDKTGRPAIWEVLADGTGSELIFVAASLESTAAAEFGKPLPGRQYAVERSLGEAPQAVVARMIDDGPLPMGPMVYLRADSREVGTIICRCMPAQVKSLAQTIPYELLPLPPGALLAILDRPTARRAFWPGNPATDRRLEQCLRLPMKF